MYKFRYYQIVLYLLIVFFINFLIVSSALSKGLTIIRDAETEELLQKYTNPILEAAELNKNHVGLYIIGSNELNAFVSHGQNIFIYTGLILATETPNELKGVIAHETGHIAGGHLARSNKALSAATGVGLTTLAIGLAAALLGSPGAAIAILGSAPQFASINLASYTRIQESSADQAALDYLTLSEQSGQGLLDFFNTFRYQELVSNSRRYQYFRSHPLSSDRIAALQQKLKQSPFKNRKDTDSELKEFEIIKAKLYGYIRTPQETFQTYPETDQSIKAYYARTFAYLKMGDKKLALKEINILISKNSQNPYFYETKGQIYFETGQAKLAIKSYEKAVSLKPNSALLMISLAQALLADDSKQHAKRAIQLLNKALEIEKEDSMAWYQLSIAYEALKKTDLAKLAIAEQAFALGDFRRANIFANRAKSLLDKNTSHWLRANDIIIITDLKLKHKKNQQYQK